MATKKSTTTTTTTTTTTEEVLNPLVPTASLVSTEQFTVLEGQVFCSSLKIAEHFEKEHFNVLRDIEKVIAEILAEGGRVDDKFSKGEYEIVNNLGHKVKKPSYLLTRNGFMVLVMGYQGQKAMKYKLQYIAAFDQMETYIKQQLAAKPITITNAQYNRVRDLIHHMSRYTHQKEQTASMLMNRIRFMTNSDSVKNIPHDQYETVIQYLEHSQQLADQYLLPYLVEIEHYFFNQILCNDVPFTGTIGKNWKKHYGEALPRPVNWKEAALQLEGAVST